MKPFPVQALPSSVGPFYMAGAESAGQVQVLTHTQVKELSLQQVVFCFDQWLTLGSSEGCH